MAFKTAKDVLHDLILSDDSARNKKENELLQDEEYASLLKKHKDLTIRYLFEDDAAILEDIKKAEAELDKKRNEKCEDVCSICRGKRIYAKGICACTLPKVYEECLGAFDVSLFKESFCMSDHSVFDDKEALVSGKTQKDIFMLAERKAKVYANDFPASPLKNLLFTGASGLGKTFLLRCIAKEVSKKAPVCYMTAGDLSKVFLAHRLGEDVELKLLYDAPLLIIDDLGTEAMYQNVTVEYLSELIEKRHFSDKHTVFSTNLSVRDIKERYGERISSRLSFKDIGVEVRFLGKDIRKK